MEINELTKRIHNINKQKGFWEKERPFSEVVVLCHSELSEAFEEYRHKEHLPNGGMYYYSDAAGEKYEKLDAEKTYKPEGMASEMIDEIIRILDWCGSENLDVEKLIEEKLHYNENRPYKHGKNC